MNITGTIKFSEAPVFAVLEQGSVEFIKLNNASCGGVMYVDKACPNALHLPNNHFVTVCDDARVVIKYSCSRADVVYRLTSKRVADRAMNCIRYKDVPPNNIFSCNGRWMWKDIDCNAHYILDPAGVVDISPLADVWFKAVDLSDVFKHVSLKIAGGLSCEFGDMTVGCEFVYNGFCYVKISDDQGVYNSIRIDGRYFAQVKHNTAVTYTGYFYEKPGCELLLNAFKSKNHTRIQNFTYVRIGRVFEFQDKLWVKSGERCATVLLEQGDSIEFNPTTIVNLFCKRDEPSIDADTDGLKYAKADVDMMIDLYNRSLKAKKPKPLKIDHVIFSGPVTVVVWTDGTLTRVRAQKGDRVDYEKGLAMAISKKFLGNNNKYYDEFKKWVPIRNKSHRAAKVDERPESKSNVSTTHKKAKRRKASPKLKNI